jgi:hypothetical protein
MTVSLSGEFRMNLQALLTFDKIQAPEDIWCFGDALRRELNGIMRNLMMT